MSTATEEHGEIPEGFQVLREGKATVIYRHGESFYNNVQVVNRDMSCMMLRVYDDYRRERIAELGAGIMHLDYTLSSLFLIQLHLWREGE